MGVATRTRLTAATTGIANQFVASVNMANGSYTIANASPPWAGACFVVATITGVTGNDTPGSIVITGTDLAGNVISETLALVAGGSATSARTYRTITSIVQSGWAINGGNDTIVIGCAAGSIACGTSGTLHGIIVNTTAAGTVILADSVATIAVLKASIAEGFYGFPPGIDFSGYLKATLAAASDVTIVHTPTNPTGLG